MQISGIFDLEKMPKTIVGLVSALFICLCCNLWAATCSERNTSQLCWGQNSASNGYCYWYSPMWQVYSCAECKNTPVTLTNGVGNVYSGTVPNGVDYSIQCPMKYTCNSGYAVNVQVSGNGLVIGGQTYTPVCKKCAADEWADADKFVLNFGRDVNGNVENMWQAVSDAGALVGTGLANLGCKTCGSYATVNSVQTNCDCNTHYAYRETGSSDLQVVNVKSNSCSPIEYRICFNHTSAKECNNYIRYKYKEGYDPYDSGNYGVCPGCDLGYIMEHPNDNRYYFDSWWSGVNGTGKQYFSGNIIYEDSYNIADECVKDNSCEIENIDTINLYAKWLPKSYTVTYMASYEDKECGSTQTCKYFTDCTAGSGYSSVKTCVNPGKTLKGWKCISGCTSDFIAVGNAIPEPAVGENIVLQAVPQDCTPGYYCYGETKTPCPAGTTSDAGAYSREMCKVTSETKFCDGNGFCFNLPISGGVYVK